MGKSQRQIAKGSISVESVDIQSPGVLKKILTRDTEILVREYEASHVVFHGDPYLDSDINLLVVKKADKESDGTNKRDGIPS